MSDSRSRTVHAGSVQDRAERFREEFELLVANVAQVIVGKDDVIRMALICLCAEGHLLLKDLPGTGKTLLARSIARSIRCSFKRIQFTPDLLPMDITGANIFNLQEKRFLFQPGPLFAQLILADEINRASPKTQSALLEAMAEEQVSVEGHTHRLPDPFMVVATMNPLDHAGTYPLPPAQLDRFSMQLSMGFPAAPAEIRMLETHLAPEPAFETLSPILKEGEFAAWQALVRQVLVSEPIRKYLVDLANRMRSDSRVLGPPSPRSLLLLARCCQARALTRSRAFVNPHDVAAVAPAVLAHRLIMRGDLTAAAFVTEILGEVAVPSR